FPHEQRGKSGTTADYLAVFRSTHRRMQISEFPTGDFGSNRQAVSVETDRPFRSKAAPRCGWVLVPTLANRRRVIHPILLWSAKASTLVIIVVSNDCCGRLSIVLIMWISVVSYLFD